MTLVVAIPAQDSVILGSDSEIMIGAIRSTGRKIFKLNDRIIWGASGSISIAQRANEAITARRDDFRNQSLAELRSELASIVKQALKSCIVEDIRIDVFRDRYKEDPNKIFELYPADFLFVEYRDRPRILHILNSGTSEWIIGRCAASGSGQMFAYALLQKYSDTPLVCSTAKLLAYKVVAEAIPVASYGLGEPIDIWEAKSDGVKQCSEAERTALEDSARALREAEVSWLASDECPDTSTTQ